MDGFVDNRRENRLRYNWPVWFADNFNEMLSQGQMVDVSSNGAAFTCYADKCPYEGQQITTRFSVPRHGSSDPFDLENFVRTGKICRIEDAGPFVKRVAIQFAEPLPFKPGEVSETLALEETTSALETATQQALAQEVVAHEIEAMQNQIEETPAVETIEI